MAVLAIRGIARRFIPEMIGLGYNTTKMLGILRGQGLSYRRTDFLSDVRQFTGQARKRDPLKAIPKKLRPTAATTQVSEYTQKAKFNYSYKVTGYDVFQDKDVEEWITVSSDDVLTMEQAQEIAEDLTKKYKSELEVREVGIDAVTTWQG